MVFPAVFNLSSLNGKNGFVINGINSSDGSSGSSVSSAGDINADGIADIIIGAPGVSPPNVIEAGQSYVIFGTKKGFSTLFELSSLNGQNGFVINGNIIDNSGASVSSAGDVNADGIADFIVGAPGMGNSVGNYYVIFGKNSEFTSPLNLSLLNGNNGFEITGVNYNFNSRCSVSGRSDVNADGIADVIIGIPVTCDDPYLTSRRHSSSYVIFGKNDGFSSPFELNSLNGVNGFTINGTGTNPLTFDGLGASVSGAGDINADGIADIVIGASRASPNGNQDAGQSYVIFGTKDGFSSSFALNSLDGQNGFAINGINDGDELGFSVSSAGDVNADGIADIIISAAGANNYTGQSYVIFGRSGGFNAIFNLSALNGTNGFAINGISANDDSGWSISSAGDVNGDGIADIIIGADDASPNGNIYAGQSYVIFGDKTGFNAVFNLSALNGINGFAVNGINAGDRLGASVSGAGDINGDGIADIIIGADGASPNGNQGAGQSYVIFGESLSSSELAGDLASNFIEE